MKKLEEGTSRGSVSSKKKKRKEKSKEKERDGEEEGNTRLFASLRGKNFLSTERGNIY